MRRPCLNMMMSMFCLIKTFSNSIKKSFRWECHFSFHSTCIYMSTCVVLLVPLQAITSINNIKWSPRTTDVRRFCFLIIFWKFLWLTVKDLTERLSILIAESKIMCLVLIINHNYCHPTVIPAPINVWTK